MKRMLVERSTILGNFFFLKIVLKKNFRCLYIYFLREVKRAAIIFFDQIFLDWFFKKLNFNFI